MNEKEVFRNIQNIYIKRRIVLYALALEFAAKALRSFYIKQRSNTFWHNKTGQARDTMFTRAFIESNVVGFLMAHMVDYGPKLETANNGIHQAIRPTMNIYVPLFIYAAKKLFADVV